MNQERIDLINISLEDSKFHLHLLEELYSDSHKKVWEKEKEIKDIIKELEAKLEEKDGRIEQLETKLEESDEEVWMEWESIRCSYEMEKTPNGWSSWEAWC